MAHRYDSWGRTRRPKNIAGPDGTALINVADIATAQAITNAVLEELGAGASLAAPMHGVYSTENQRFLHLSSINSGAVSNIYVFYYASGKWAELVDSSNNTIVLQANEAKVVEIAGADLVAFTMSDATSVYAACSTF